MTRKIVIDTCVLTAASSDSNEAERALAASALMHLYDRCHSVVLDKPKGRILKEYRRHAFGFGAAWLSQVLIRENKIFKVSVNPRELDCRIPTERFDRKFMLAADISPDKLLLTGDRDRGFDTPKVRSYLRKRGIRIISYDEVLTEL